jgi:hypothetical protein
LLALQTTQQLNERCRYDLSGAFDGWHDERPMTASKRRWRRFCSVPIAAISTLLGAFFGFWISLVAFLNIPDPAPALPDWVWVVPYAFSLVAGLASLWASMALMRRLTKK